MGKNGKMTREINREIWQSSCHPLKIRKIDHHIMLKWTLCCHDVFLSRDRDEKWQIAPACCLGPSERAEKKTKFKIWHDVTTIGPKLSCSYVPFSPVFSLCNQKIGFRAKPSGNHERHVSVGLLDRSGSLASTTKEQSGSNKISAVLEIARMLCLNWCT